MGLRLVRFFSNRINRKLRQPFRTAPEKSFYSREEFFRSGHSLSPLGRENSPGEYTHTTEFDALMAL